ncbi:acyl-CoA dehydrogenase [Solimonas marina]|uniref:3-methylmercaptopropionyl-CoA dehydrogenase n=1 Tax=Solimonas marina TaxID=2714601 RepID=A0A969W721_9GAMM|nr:acyl-CoA dehydrogenase [Solimonas marina]NKF21866.1 acyl-CoA dehydrogenase [Solimonas marina]
MSDGAPIDDLMFCIEELRSLDDDTLTASDVDHDTTRAVLEACARFATEELETLDADGDRLGAQWRDGSVRMPPGFRDAYRRYVDAGWQGLQHPAVYGGQALPQTTAAACAEIINAANLGFALCPLLTDGAIEALLTAGSAAQCRLYVPRLVSGEWTGTMNLTEPQAGSDLALLKARAELQADGSYRLFGQKIFITYGDHDLTDNIIHLVLARTADAPPGVRGISLFVVPKFLVDDQGRIGARNDVRCVSIEHKLGIHASPTATLAFGEGEGEGQGGRGAVAYLLGAEHEGLQAMFVMMNLARFRVGVQGIGVAQRAYRKAARYARERVQSRPVDGRRPNAVAIVEHPDVRRMLMTMRAHIEATRALAIHAASLADAAEVGLDPDGEARALYEFLVPLLKGYATEMCVDVTSLGIQIHGGMGFIEETGAAQHYRDARILPIYEGTTAIQANDLIGRKLLRDGGHIARRMAARIERVEHGLAAAGGIDHAAIRAPLRRLRLAFLDAVEFMLGRQHDNVNAIYAAAVPFLQMAARLVAGGLLARCALAATRRAGDGGDTDFLDAKRITARFYAEHIVAPAVGLRDVIIYGGNSALALAAGAF